ncbi:protein kinase domain-containing protein [Marinactinospora thermotolerans]|uniref:serine/threonine-protein kinase n=1 Tax=Marinactinospora thermotolerans TaxID=531310 RepID=UPI003D8FB821
MSTEQSEPGRLLVGRYRLSHLIGEGGMGRVWQGTDELLDRPVAIKELTISAQLPEREITILRTRMLREARSAAQLSHPSIITVFDVVESDDRPWIVMELVRGSSLSELLKEHGALPPTRVAKIALQVLSGLAVAHQRGIVHRDIKPGNVLIAKDDRAVLTDFGIARLEDSNTQLTSTGNLLGSPNYLAPEQARGQLAGPSTDMWAMGITMYAAVEGKPPFQRSTAMATLTAIVTEEVPPPTSAGPLRPVLDGLLDKDPSRRLTVEEAVAMLHPIVVEGQAEEDGEATRVAPVAAGPVPAESTAEFASVAPPPGPGRRPVTRLLVPALLAVVGLVLAAALGLWLANGNASDQRGDAPVEPSEAPSQAPETVPASAEESIAADPTAAEEPEQEGDAEDAAEDTPMRRHEDPTGFEIEVPEGWELERRDNGVFFTNPEGGYLQIDQTDQPGEDALEDWNRQEGAISSNFGGYEKVAITRLDDDSLDLDDYVSAADWEFTFDGSQGRMRAVNRAFHTEEKGYALFLVSTEEDWETNRALLDEMTRSFEPAD